MVNPGNSGGYPANGTVVLAERGWQETGLVTTPGTTSDFADSDSRVRGSQSRFAGLAIVNDLRIAGIQAATILVDYATYEAYEQYGAWTDDKGKPVPCSPRRQLPALTLGEQHLYQFLTDPEWTRVRRVEQERIPLRVAAARLGALITR